MNYWWWVSGLGGHAAKVTDGPIPHGPGLLREAADGPELQCKLDVRALGRPLQALGCCCCGC